MIICIDTFFIGRHRIERNIPGLFACDLVWNSVTEIICNKVDFTFALYTKWSGHWPEIKLLN